MKHSIAPDTTLLNEMGKIRTTISLEAINLTGIHNALSNFFPTIKENFEIYIHNFANASKENPIALKSNQQDFIKLISQQQYLNLVPLQAFVPEGLVVPYLEYLKELLAAVQHCEKTTMQSINDYSVFLSQTITNREQKFSMSSFGNNKFDYMEASRNILNKNLGECFGKGLTRTDVSYGDVVTRNNEWVEVLTDINAAMNSISRISRNDLRKKAEECANLLDVIIKQIKNNEFEGVGPEVTNTLSNGAYQVASELEFFTVTYYKVATLTNAISDTMNKVTDIIKNQK